MISHQYPGEQVEIGMEVFSHALEEEISVSVRGKDRPAIVPAIVDVVDSVFFKTSEMFCGFIFGHGLEDREIGGVLLVWGRCPFLIFILNTFILRYIPSRQTYQVLVYDKNGRRLRVGWCVG